MLFKTLNNNTLNNVFLNGKILNSVYSLFNKWSIIRLVV